MTSHCLPLSVSCNIFTYPNISCTSSFFTATHHLLLYASCVLLLLPREDSSGVSYVPAAPPSPPRPPPANHAISPRNSKSNNDKAQSPTSSRSSLAAEPSSDVWVSGDGTALPVEWFEVNQMAKRYPPDPDPLPTSTSAAAATPASSSSSTSQAPPPPSLPLHAYTPLSYGLVGSALGHETEGWIPHAAATAALRFQTTKLPPGLPPAEMHLFLREVNHAWQQREKAHVR